MRPIGRKPRSRGEPGLDQSFGHDVLQWVDTGGKAHMAPADSRATGLGLEKAVVYRQGVKYPQRRNYEGYYWFSRTGRHVWYESLTEYSALMWLDFSQTIVGISTQPFRILFADGTSHYPDIFTVLRDGTQTLYDVRPESRIDDEAAATFAKTADLCQRIGWPYQVLGELDRPMRHNLEWLAAYRHPRYEPPPEVRETILNYLAGSAPLADVAQAVSAGPPAFSIHFIYHLLWTREIHADLARPLSWNTTLERGHHV